MKVIFTTLVVLTVAVGAARTQVSAQALSPSRAPLPKSLAASQSFARDAFDGDRARDIVAFMGKYFRLPGNTGFDASIRRVWE